jgi:diguanylate cyclase (GGDEF)-like protein
VAAAAVVIVLTASTDHWDLVLLGVIVGLTVCSELTSVQSGRLYVSGSLLGTMLAAVLLGGGPAAVVGALSVTVGWLRSREGGLSFRANLVTYIWFPLISGLAFYLAVRATGVGPEAPLYYLLAFGAFVLGLSLNVVMVNGYQSWLTRSSLARNAQDSIGPILPSELFSAVLTVAAVYMTIQAGTVALALFAVVLVIFQYLVGALLLSKRRAEDMERMATTDELTGLPNRETFRDRLQAQIDAVERPEETFAVMLMDLDRFKEVNDTLGHHYGDELLRQLGPRLAECVGPQGVVARLGGDEFGILSGRSGDKQAYNDLASMLLEVMQEPLVVDEMSLEVGASIGIARYPEDGHDAHQLLKCADIAMYAAKASQTGVTVFTPEHDRHSVRKLHVVGDVRRAIESTEMIVHYQPQVGLVDMRVHGAEALVRWQHPELGLLPPSAFISAVEQTGLISPLTRHVLDRSIEQAAAWWHSGRELSVAVNLSVRNLLDRDLPVDVEQMLGRYDLPPEALKLELTESMIMSDPDRALATLNRLNRLGVRISVDDFGTGYSSLQNLKRLPIDELKIDRSFVTQMLQDENDLIIVRSTVNLGHDLGLRVIAEGVEDQATLERLSGLGCDLAQGYHVSRPMSAEAFDKWLVSARWGVKAELAPVAKKLRGPRALKAAGRAV